MRIYVEILLKIAQMLIKYRMQLSYLNISINEIILKRTLLLYYLFALNIIIMLV